MRRGCTWSRSGDEAVATTLTPSAESVQSNIGPVRISNSSFLAAGTARSFLPSVLFTFCTQSSNQSSRADYLKPD